MTFFRSILIGALCAVFVVPAWGASQKNYTTENYAGWADYCGKNGNAKGRLYVIIQPKKGGYFPKGQAWASYGGGTDKNGVRLVSASGAVDNVGRADLGYMCNQYRDNEVTLKVGFNDDKLKKKYGTAEIKMRKTDKCCVYKVVFSEDAETSATTPAKNTTTPVKGTTNTSTTAATTAVDVAAAGTVSASVGNKDCGKVGQKECNGSYYVCRNNADCVKGKLPSYATAGHCVSAGRSGYNVCTATACNDDYEVKSGHCQKKKAVAETPAVKSATGCIVGRVADPKDVAIEGVVVSIKDKNDIKTTTDKDGKFKLCGVDADDHFLTVIKQGYASSDSLVHYDNNLDQYIDNKDKLLDVRMDPWFLEKNVTISAFFSDIPDCKVGNGVINIHTHKDPVNNTDGCQQHPADGGFGELKTDENGNFTLDCYYPGIEFWYVRVAPIEPGDLKSHMFTWVTQHPSLFNEKQVRGKNGTDYSIGNTTNKDFVADYRMDAGGNFSDGLSAKELKRVLDKRVKDGVITQAEADEYWKKALKNCPDAQPSEETNTGSDEDSMSDAEDAYQNAKDKENSTANKMLGGLTMAATGIGGMQLAQGLAEQSADAAAESDMTAYLQTFQCKIGDKRFRGGEMGVGTGTGNELIELYQQYVDLAADLKERKAALGIKAGIESEVIMDKANAGLYDDTGKGIENGTYASLYRASKGNDTDKSKFDDAKDTSANRVKYGGVAAGVGAVGGLIGNAIINDDDDDDENVTESDCKKAGGTFKDKKCTCKDKNKKYKNGKCVNKSDSDSGLDLGAIGASLGSNLGSGAAGLLQGVAGGDGGGAAQLLQGVAGGGNAAGVLQNAGSLLGQ